MPHLVETIRNTEISHAITTLEKSHKLIVEQSIIAQKTINLDSLAWGEQLKRLEVLLPFGEELIGKKREKFVEIINILATVERTISALKWMVTKYPNGILRECHPSTSDDEGGNDIVITEKSGTIIARCEVTDITSSNASQNGKEKKDLKLLGCADTVPSDLVSRYIATSTEFANALSSPNRKWDKMHYQYIRHETGHKNKTVLLEIKSKLPLTKNN